MPRPKTRGIAWPLVACVVWVLWSDCAYAAPVYNIADLGTLPGTTQSIATGINSQGQVVGISYNTHDVLNGYDAGAQSFLYSAGGITQINPLGGLANAINDSGKVVGGLYYDINNGGQYVGYGRLYSGNNQTVLGQNLSPFTINNSGEVGGGIVVPTIGGFVYHAGVYSDGTVNDVSGPVVGDSSYVAAINSRGDMLITAATGTVSNSTLVVNGIYTSLASLTGGGGKVATGLNDHDQVVGNNFLYSGGQFYALTALIPTSSGWSQLDATRINDAGQIIGQGMINGQEHAFLMSPLTQTVPEPSSWLVFGSGTAIGLIQLARRRSRIR